MQIIVVAIVSMIDRSLGVKQMLEFKIIKEFIVEAIVLEPQCKRETQMQLKETRDEMKRCKVDLCYFYSFVCLIFFLQKSYSRI